MMYSLSQEQIKHTLMPLGVYETKDEVRQIAEQEDLIVARKNDSQEICFVIDDDYARFVKEHTLKPIPKGNFVDTKGEVLGEHKGIIHYTIGQRKGLGMTFGKPMYVVEIRPKTNEVVLGDNKDVFKKELVAKEANFITFDHLESPYKCEGKVRYSSKTSPCTLFKLDNNRVRVVFDEPQRAVTPGQAVVFYRDNLLVGGGVIE